MTRPQGETMKAMRELNGARHLIIPLIPERNAPPPVYAGMKLTPALLMIWLGAFAGIAAAAEAPKPAPPDPEYCARRDADPEKCVIQDGPPRKPIVHKKPLAPQKPPVPRN